MDAPLPAVVAAALPLAALAVLVFRSSLGLGPAAWIVAAGAAVLAVTVFGLGGPALAAGAAKGAWTGLWILLLVVPGLLLYEVAQASGALDRLSDQLGVVAPTTAGRLLLIAWVFPSFLQGVAGFGVPVVVAAPMLVRLGLSPVNAVAACLVGYHWSVTFGSMGSSFFVAAGTAQLSEAASQVFAMKAAGLLSLSALSAGLVLLYRAEGGRQAVRPALIIGAVMCATLVGVAAVQPALASTSAGLAGLLCSWLVLPAGNDRPPVRPLLTAAAPYLALTAIVVVAFGVPPVRDLAARVPALAPSFPETVAAFGHVNPPIEAHQPLRPLLHAGPYLLLATAFGAALFHRIGWWPDAAGRRLAAAWARRSRSTIVSLLGLTVLAGVMVEAGMLEAIAQAFTRLLGIAYVVVAPVVGASGTVLTGSTTASNALLAPLQAGAAERLGLPVTTLLAAQTAGGNLGNALTPINALVAGAAVGAAGAEGDILRRSARRIAPVAALVVAGVVVMAALS